MSTTVAWYEGEFLEQPQEGSFTNEYSSRHLKGISGDVVVRAAPVVYDTDKSEFSIIFKCWEYSSYVNIEDIMTCQDFKEAL